MKALGESGGITVAIKPQVLVVPGLSPKAVQPLSLPLAKEEVVLPSAVLEAPVKHCEDPITASNQLCNAIMDV